MRTVLLLLISPLLVYARPAAVTSGEYSVQLTASDIIAFHGGQRLLSLRETYRPAFEQYRENIPKDMFPCTYEHAVEVISLTGPLLGIRDSLYTYCSGAAHPAVEQRLATRDLAHGGREVSITDLFPETAVLAALLKDPLLASHLKRQPSNLANLRAALPADGVPAGKQGCQFLLSQDFMKSFAFHHSTPKGIAVRLSLEPAAEPCRGVSADLGLLLPITPKLAGNTMVKTPAQSVSIKIAFELK